MNFQNMRLLDTCKESINWIYKGFAKRLQMIQNQQLHTEQGEKRC